MRKFSILAIAFMVSLTVAQGVEASSHREYNVRRFPSGFCYSKRFMSTAEEVSYDTYFNEWSARYENSQQIQRQIEANRAVIEKVQGILCSQ